MDTVRQYRLPVRQPLGRASPSPALLMLLACPEPSERRDKICYPSPSRDGNMQEDRSHQ